MKKALLAGVAALSMLCASAAHTREWQGNMPKPVGKLPSHPPVVCVTPNWTAEPCESRQPSPKQAGTAHADDLGDILKPLWDFFKWTETNWLGTILVDYRPWDGAWPTARAGDVEPEVVVPMTVTTINPGAPASINGIPTKDAHAGTTILYYEPGGDIIDHVRRWSELAASGDNVEIRGTCVSACTMIMAYVPRERICFGTHSSLQFHIARLSKTGKTMPEMSQSMLDLYPEDIRKWLIARGGVDKMTIMDMWALKDWQLWRMGYRKCEPEARP